MVLIKKNVFRWQHNKFGILSNLSYHMFFIPLENKSWYSCNSTLQAALGLKLQIHFFFVSIRVFHIFTNWVLAVWICPADTNINKIVISILFVKLYFSLAEHFKFLLATTQLFFKIKRKERNFIFGIASCISCTVHGWVARPCVV